MSRLEFLFMFFFVLVRVISWIVIYAAKKDPQNHTNHQETQQRADRTSNSSFDTLSESVGHCHSSVAPAWRNERELSEPSR